MPLKKSVSQISKATVQRLPGYLLYLRACHAEGKEYISSTVIADDLKQNSVQVRKDLAIVSVRPGKPKMGFRVTELIGDIEDFLGYNNTNEAVLVGAGQLGKTLLSFGGFEPYGFKIVAGFDRNRAVVGKVICGKRVYHIDTFFKTLSAFNAEIGIITVPAPVAQDVCDMMVKAGIKAIWNFAPTHLTVPPEIVIKNEDLGASLAMLGKELNEKRS